MIIPQSIINKFTSELHFKGSCAVVSIFHQQSLLDQKMIELRNRPESEMTALDRLRAAKARYPNHPLAVQISIKVGSHQQ